MRVLICGDRDYDKPHVINVLLEGLFFTAEPSPEALTIIEGCARGADKVACEWDDPAVTHMHFPAEWDKYGKAAGPIRNKQMLDAEPDVVFAFHDNIKESRGTKDMATIASEAGIPVYVVSRYEG